MILSQEENKDKFTPCFQGVEANVEDKMSVYTNMDYWLNHKRKPFHAHTVEGTFAHAHFLQ